MLVQLPRGSAEAPKGPNPDECSAFEAALRKDLATAPVVSYDSVLGGWTKRAFDLTLTVLGAPIWAPVMAIYALGTKMKHPAPVFIAEQRIGYGGRSFKRYRMRTEPPTATIAHLHPQAPEDVVPANDWGSIASSAEDKKAKWRRFYERLPQLWNVIRGEMSLVGPAALVHDDIEQLKTGKRYYLSSRPGVMGVATLVDPDMQTGSEYKAYALSWSVLLDVLLMWDGIRGFRDKGELWKPQWKIKAGKKARAAGEAVARRRGNGA